MFVEKEDIVVARAVEFVPPQAGLLPVDTVRRLGIEDDVSRASAQARRARLLPLPQPCDIPHAKKLGVLVVVDAAIDIDAASLPGAVRHENRLLQLARRMQRAHDALLGADYLVINEKLRL